MSGLATAKFELYTNIFSFFGDPLLTIENIIRDILYMLIVLGSIYFVKNIIKI